MVVEKINSWTWSSKVLMGENIPGWLYQCESSQLCKTGFSWEMEPVRWVYVCVHKKRSLRRNPSIHLGRWVHSQTEDESAVLRANHVLQTKPKCLRNTRGPNIVPSQWLAGIRPRKNWCFSLRPKAGEIGSEELGGKRRDCSCSLEGELSCSVKGSNWMRLGNAGESVVVSCMC